MKWVGINVVTNIAFAILGMVLYNYYYQHTPLMESIMPSDAHVRVVEVQIPSPPCKVSKYEIVHQNGKPTFESAVKKTD